MSSQLIWTVIAAVIVLSVHSPDGSAINAKELFMSFSNLPISCYIRTLNEERKIGEVILAAKKISSEVILIDSLILLGYYIWTKINKIDVVKIYGLN